MAISTKFSETIMIEGESWIDCREQAKEHFDLHDYQPPQPQVEQRPKAYAELTKLQLIKLLKEYAWDICQVSAGLIETKNWVEDRLG